MAARLRSRMPASDKRLMLLDTASMYFRAFYGVPEIVAPRTAPTSTRCAA